MILTMELKTKLELEIERIRKELDIPDDIIILVLDGSVTVKQLLDVITR